MNVAVCVPWRDSGCPHRQAAWEWVQARWAQLHSHWPVVLGSCEGSWNIAAALNDCIEQAPADVVVLVGADTVIDEHDLELAVKAASEGEWVLPAGELVRLDQPHTTAVLAMPTDTSLQAPGVCQRSQRGWGPIVAPLALLRLIGGWDERFVGWGGEDEAFYLTARTLIGEPTRIEGSVHLLWHPPTGNPRHVDNLALLARYDDAIDDPDLIRGLIAERTCEFTASMLRCIRPVRHEGAHRLR